VNATRPASCSTANAALVNGAAAAAGLTERHIVAAGITAADMLTDDGLLDAEKLSDAISQAVEDFGIRKPRPPQPNPQQGLGGGPGRGASHWGQALKGH
jgi:hypothetical protein